MKAAAAKVDGIIAAFAAKIADHHRPFALIGRFCVQAGTGGRIEKAFAAASVHTASEAGVLAYRLHRHTDDPNVFVVYEHWRSLADLEAHLRTNYIEALRGEIEAVLQGEPHFEIMVPT